MIPTFQLGGVDFGGDHPVQVVGFDPGSGSTRTQDVDVPMGDGRLMGRDFHSAPSWMFDFYTNVWDWAEALALADTVAAVWSGDQVRDTPGEVMPLRYWMANRWRRVYGRPRNFSPPDGGLFSKLGRAEFAPYAAHKWADVPNAVLVKLGQSLNQWTLLPSGSDGHKKAEATRGGVNVKEIDPKTMQSKLQPGLYFIGEVMDITGWLGGYNFQWAWSSAVCAAEAVCRESA